jgi:hypothetical protein
MACAVDSRPDLDLFTIRAFLSRRPTADCPIALSAGQSLIPTQSFFVFCCFAAAFPAGIRRGQALERQGKIPDTRACDTCAANLMSPRAGMTTKPSAAETDADCEAGAEPAELLQRPRNGGKG